MKLKKSLLKKAYKSILSKIINRTFPIWEKLGFHITLNRYYSPIPNTRSLKDNLWKKRSKLIGIDIICS